ncbi:MAG: hypothetical protein AB1422_08790 [bacterium]
MFIFQKNIMKELIIFSYIFVLVEGCSGEKGIKTLEDNNILSVLLKPKDQDKFKFGEISEAVFILKNHSNKAIVVLNIKPITNHGEDSIVLSSSAYGSISKLDNEDAYCYNGMIQCATSMLFHACLLLPNQEVLVLCNYRPISKTECFTVEYVSAKDKYDGTLKSLSPLNIYLIDKNKKNGWSSSIYRPFVEKNWLNICKETPQTGQVGPDISERAVIIPGLPARPTVLTTKVSIELENGTFSVESAQKVATKILGSQLSNIQLGYSSALGGYIVLERNFSWLLRNDYQENRGRLLSHFPLTMLKDIDSFGTVTICIGNKQEGFGPERHDAGWKFWNIYTVGYGDGMYTRGEFIQINKTSLVDFLEQVKEKDGKITEYKYFFRSRYFVLELPKM